EMLFQSQHTEADATIAQGISTILSYSRTPFSAELQALCMLFQSLRTSLNAYQQSRSVLLTPYPCHPKMSLVIFNLSHSDRCKIESQTRTSSTTLNRYGESGQPCLVPGFSGIALIFSPFNIILAFVYIVYYIDLFSFVESILRHQDEIHLIEVDDLFNVFFDSG
ncbi:hypothetical protein STEG23_019021, partial [Scotinomys teguina]